jgi:alanine racemase
MVKGLRTWAEINLDNLAHNIKEIRENIKPNVKIMAVVKADAYGHGAIEVSRTLLENGVDRLAVATVDEVIQLREAGIKVPIMVLGFTSSYNIMEIIEYNIIPAVIDLEFAKELSKVAVKMEKKVKIHIKIDTGMGRIGFRTESESSINDIIKISKFPMLEVEGIFTHFSSADEEDKSFTYTQFNKFTDIISKLEKKGVNIPIKHVCNSASIIEFKEMHLDLVRPGIMLYGYFPSRNVKKDSINLKPVMTLKTCVVYIKDVEKGVPISYGRTYYTDKYSKVATLSVGYADGFSRMLSGKAKVLVHNKIVPVVGRITMDQCMIDVSSVKNIKVDDEVILMGGTNEEISADNLAKNLGTISYELVCMVGHRVKRVYIKDNKIIKIKNKLFSNSKVEMGEDESVRIKKNIN